MGKEGIVLGKDGGVLVEVDSQAEIKGTSYGIKQNQRRDFLSSEERTKKKYCVLSPIKRTYMRIKGGQKAL